MGVFLGPSPTAHNARIERRLGNWWRLLCFLRGHEFFAVLRVDHEGHIEHYCRTCGAVEVWDWTP